MAIKNVARVWDITTPYDLQHNHYFHNAANDRTKIHIDKIQHATGRALALYNVLN